MKPAQRSKLAQLHAKLADVLADGLEWTDEEGKADIGVMRLTAAFLKDNDITCDDDTGDTRNAQLDRLNEMRRTRTVASTPMDELH